MKYGLVFVMLGLACGFDIQMADSVWSKILLANVALCFVGAGSGFLGVGARVFLKRRDGALPLVSYLLYWPYYLLNWMGLMLLRSTGKENPWDEILPNLYLGRQITWFDREKARRFGFVTVLDLTGEFGERRELRTAPQYKCLPILDTFPPTEAQLAEGVAFITAHIGQGPVFVHCAAGHGRSATFVAAYLISAGLAADAEAAEKQMQAQRPRVGLHTRQKAILHSFAIAHPPQEVPGQTGAS